MKDKERIEQLEKHVKLLLDAKEENDRLIAIRNEINKFKEEQEKGFFKYTFDVFKLFVILAALYTGGTKAIDHPWFSELLK